jgi:putative transcriptional regulator
MSGSEIRAIRRGLGLSQRKFCERFAFGLWTLKRWEQDKKRPTRTAELLLTVIGHDPAAVDRAIASRKPSPPGTLD